MPESVELTVESIHEAEARQIAALTDWVETEGILLKVVCAVCLRQGHPTPFVVVHRDVAGVVTLDCPHRKLVYDGPAFGPGS